MRLFIYLGLPDTLSPAEWISKSLKKGSLIGVDPTLYSKDEWDTMETELSFSGKKLMAVNQNLVDLIWAERPSRPLNNVVQHPIEFSGKSVMEKLDDVRKEMGDAGSDLLVIAELDEVACMYIIDYYYVKSRILLKDFLFWCIFIQGY